MKCNTIGFIGLGLIGGSIAKAILNIYPHTKIIALASRESTIAAAYDEHLINNNSFIPVEDFKECDIIFLCSPVGINCEYLKKLKNIVRKDCILTDVGSVKGDITKVARELNITNQFIGGHPMTGSELTGLENSSPSLLENAYYILTADEDLDQKLLDDFAEYIETLGAISLKLSPEEHDKATASISHVPHIIAAALVNMVQDNDNEMHTCKTIAAGGFKDITRIASSSPVMWQHIFMSNKEAVLELTDKYIEQINRFKTAIENDDSQALIDLWTKSKDYRDSITIPENDHTRHIYELYIDIDDKPGTMVAVLSLLANGKVSIKNIDIIHNREYEAGVLRLEFYTSESQKKAKTILKYNDYYVRQRTK